MKPVETIYRPHFYESADVPSMLNTSTNEGGVPSMLSTLADVKPNFDRVTIQGMRNNPLYSGHDDIDTIGLAQKQIMEVGKTVSKREYAQRIRAFNDHAQKLAKPKSH